VAFKVFFKGSRLFPGTKCNRSFYFPGAVFGGVGNLPPIVGFEAPDFEERAGQFVTTLWRDWLTKEVMAGYNLNERQKKATNRLPNNSNKELPHKCPN